MRKLMVVGLVAASLGLASCGVKASIDSAVASLGSSADLQIHLTASASGAGTQAAEVQKEIGAFSVDMDYSNPTGSPLSQSGQQANEEIVVNVGNQALVDIRDVNSNLYVLINVSAISSIPGANLPASEVAGMQLLFGGRWFEAPMSLIDQYLPSTAKVKAASVKDQALEKKILDAISTLIDKTPYTTLANGGYSETGTLESVVQAVLPTIESVTGTTIPSSSSNTVKGNYTLTVTTSGSSATGASISITAPNGSEGNATVGLQATFAHASDSVVAPTGATVITPSLIKGLLSEAG